LLPEETELLLFHTGVFRQNRTKMPASRLHLATSDNPLLFAEAKFFELRDTRKSEL